MGLNIIDHEKTYSIVGSRGIGYATADKFLKEGATVILTASSQGSADKAVAQLKEKYPDATVAGISPNLSNLESVRNAFREAASKYGVDAKFLKAIAKCESDFSTECTSRSGAMGIMQLMPQTAASLGVTNAYDPYQNIMGGARYISEKLTQYNGDKSLALAAYNAGTGNVAKYGGIPPFKETQNYVAKVMAYYNS